MGGRGMRFFIDECVPHSEGRVLEAAGHEVVFLREAIPPGSPDPLVAAVSESNNAVLVSNDTDFRKLVPRKGVSVRRFRRLSRIGLQCRESRAAHRISEALSLIEHEWERAQQTDDPRIIIDITETTIRVLR